MKWAALAGTEALIDEDYRVWGLIWRRGRYLLWFGPKFRSARTAPVADDDQGWAALHERARSQLLANAALRTDAYDGPFEHHAQQFVRDLHLSRVLDARSAQSAPVTTWKQVAAVLGVSHDTVKRRREAAGDASGPRFANAEEVRKWWQEVHRPAPTRTRRATRRMNGMTLAEARLINAAD